MSFSVSKALAAALVVTVITGCGSAVEVKTTQARKGPIRESFSEPARTRLEDKFLVAMPVSARIGHLDLSPGDRVTKGQVLVPVDLLPLEKAAGEARASAAELEARVRVLADSSVEEATLARAEAELSSARSLQQAAAAALSMQEARSEWAAREARRFADLRRDRAVSQSAQEQQQVDADMAALDVSRLRQQLAQAESQVRSAELSVETQRHLIARRELERAAAEEQLAAARERLARAEHDLSLATIVSPVDGIILEKYERGGGPLASGARLFLVGSLEALEVEADALTQDAVRLKQGSPVEYTLGPGLEPLTGTVRLVEPSGFVKLSSLGVEQQRVRVISTLTTRPESLGVEYRLQARYITAEKSDALLVPRYSVLQAPDESYYLFAIENGAVRRTPVKLGLRSDITVEVLEGIAEGATLVAAPDTTLVDGTRVRPAE